MSERDDEADEAPGDGAARKSRVEALRDYVLGRDDAGAFAQGRVAMASSGTRREAARATRGDGAAAEAMLATAYYMALSDGELDEDEYDELLAIFGDLLGDEVDEDTLDDLLEDWQEALDDEGLEACLAHLAELLPSPEQRRLAFELAAGLASLDGELDDDELELFDRLAGAFSLPRDEARGLVRAWASRLR